MIVNIVVIGIVNGIVIVGAMFVGVYTVVVVINLTIVGAEVFASGYACKRLSMYHNRGEIVSISTIIINVITNIFVISVISFVSFQ